MEVICEKIEKRASRGWGCWRCVRVVLFCAGGGERAGQQGAWGSQRRRARSDGLGRKSPVVEARRIRLDWSTPTRMSQPRPPDFARGIPLPSQ